MIWRSLSQALSDLSKGGPGSGHHGHSGRPGERGGSSPGDGSPRINTIEDLRSLYHEKLKNPTELDYASHPLPDQSGVISTPLERAAIREYSINGTNINECMRNPDCKGFPDTIPVLNDMVNRARLSEEATVYRGITFRGGEEEGFRQGRELVEKFKQNVGKTITMDGLQSTSVDKRVAQDFASENFPGFTRWDPIFEIKTKRGLVVGDSSSYEDEKELLLGHKWKYRVVGVKHRVPFPNKTRFYDAKIGQVRNITAATYHDVIQLEVIE